MTDNHVHVTCAIVEKEGLVLATQRSAKMSMPLKWEFPGGKIHNGESPEECLRREILEEINLNVEIEQTLCPHTHHYSNFTVTLYPFICAIQSGELILYEHAAATWLAPKQLRHLDWAAADLPVLSTYLELKKALRYSK